MEHTRSGISYRLQVAVDVDTQAASELERRWGEARERTTPCKAFLCMTLHASLRPGHGLHVRLVLRRHEGLGALRAVHGQARERPPGCKPRSPAVAWAAARHRTGSDKQGCKCAPSTRTATFCVASP